MRFVLCVRQVRHAHLFDGLIKSLHLLPLFELPLNADGGRSKITALVDVLGTNGRAHTLLHVNHVELRVVRASQAHGGTGREGKIESVHKSVFLGELFQVLRNVVHCVEHLHGRFIFANVPNVHVEVVPREHVVVRRGGKAHLHHRVGIQLLGRGFEHLARVVVVVRFAAVN